METIKKTSEYTIYQKRSKRYGVRGADKSWINGDQKVEILVKEKLIDVPVPKPKKEPAAEAPAEEAAPAEETKE